MQFLSLYNTIIEGLSEKWTYKSIQMQFTSPFYSVDCLITMFREQSVFRRKYRLIFLTRFRYLVGCSLESRLSQTNRILFIYLSAKRIFLSEAISVGSTKIVEIAWADKISLTSSRLADRSLRLKIE